MESKSGNFRTDKSLREVGYADAIHWTEGEIDESAFKDVRLGRRFADVVRQLGDRMGESIPYACQDWASTKAAYRFFANERVEERYAQKLVMPLVRRHSEPA